VRGGNICSAMRGAFLFVCRALCTLSLLAPVASSQEAADGAPCREVDDPPATFEHKGVAVTIDQSCWKRQVGSRCDEVVKGWSTQWVAAEAKKAIDRLGSGSCIGEPIRESARKKMDRLTVRCQLETGWCGMSVPNSRALTLAAIVADGKRCAGVTMTHEMLHSHAGVGHTRVCAQDITYSCDQSCFRKNTCQECAGATCAPRQDAVHVDLCRAN
jgi:hypothetical protein